MATIVWYNLNDSPFFLRIHDFMFYIRYETLKLNIRYKMIVNADEMLLLSYYKKVEKRGFKVMYKGVELEKDYYIDCVLNKEYSEIVKE